MGNFTPLGVWSDYWLSGYVLTPGRYVGAEEIEDDDEPFEEKMKRLTAKLEEQFAESARLESIIRKNLSQFVAGK
ncbi:MAG: type I restriction endonuclease subunit M [Candidatus Binatia bacterium]